MHRVPQPPQLEGSTCSSTHDVPQSVVGGLHTVTHVPSEQAWPVAQAFPHMPQFSASLWVFVQLAPQSVVPPEQKRPHFPTEQTSPAGHTLPHFPQLSLSVLRVLQAPLQDTVPVAQVLPASLGWPVSIRWLTSATASVDASAAMMPTGVVPQAVSAATAPQLRNSALQNDRSTLLSVMTKAPWLEARGYEA